MTSSVSSSTSSSSSSTSTTTESTIKTTIGQDILSSLGVSAGANLTSLAPAIAKAQYASQNDALNRQLDKVQVQISQASQLKADLNSFQSSLSSLIDSGNLLPAPTVTDSTVASASLPLGSAGANGSYTLEVTQLAKPQVLASTSFANGATLQGGTLSFTFGTLSGSSFTADASHAAGSITIADGASLDDVAGQINRASLGLTAYVATNANGRQLVLKGKDGAANGFTITANGTGTASGTSALSSLAFDPAAASPLYTVAQGASDAAYKLDGIARTSASNTIENAAPGLTLKLSGNNAGKPTTITYSDPSAGVTTAMQNITSVLNSLVGQLNTDMAPSTGGLYNDSGAKAMAKAMAGLAGTVLMPNAAAGAPRTLADLGLATQKDGTYTLDTSKLSAALASNPSAVAAMFTKGVNGVYNTVTKMVMGLTASSDPGSLGGSVTRYGKLQSTLNDQQTSLAKLQSQMQERLIAQYSATDAAVSGYNSTLTYLKAQIAAWNGSSK